MPAAQENKRHPRWKDRLPGPIYELARGTKIALIHGAATLANVAVTGNAYRQAAIARLRGKRDGVLAVEDGSKHHDGGVWAIFVIWQQETIPWYVLNALQALSKAHVNVLAVLNASPPEAELGKLRGLVAKIMQRDNMGFDMGGYRDGALFLRQFAPRRVIFMNDSLYYVERGLDSMIAALLYDRHDVCATFENHEKRYHLQSFCFAVSGEMFAKTAGFWDTYLPVNSRVWAIEQGEIALSNELVKLGNNRHVIFNTAELARKLAGLPPETLRAHLCELSLNVRPDAAEIEALADNDLAGEIIRRVEVRSQIHTGALLFVPYLDCPLFKRDLIYREQFELEEIDGFLARIFGADSIERLDISRYFAERGSGRQHRGWTRVLYWAGIA